MDYTTFENMAETLFSQFAGLHLIYQIVIVAITVFLVMMSLTFVYNLIALIFKFTEDMFEMVIDLTKKLLRDLDKTAQNLFGTKPFMPEPIKNT